MKNIEKYKKLVLSIVVNGHGLCELAAKAHGTTNCENRKCVDCRTRVGEWLYREYEPQIDWSKVPVDTPVVVTGETITKYNRHFAKFENNEVYTFNAGATSWTAPNSIYATTVWNKTELARPEDIEKYSI